MMNILMRYNNWCESKPMKSSMISTGVITFTGDVITQYFMFRVQQKDKKLKQQQNKHQNTEQLQQPEDSFELDVKRSLIMGSYGLLVAGSMFGVWYNKILPRLAPMDFSLPRKQVLRQLGVKVLWDETLMSCSLWTAFLFYCTYLDTLDWQKCKDKWTKDFITLYKGDLLFWPWVVTSVFWFAPLHLQPVFIGTANVFWSAFCSYIQYKP